MNDFQIILLVGYPDADFQESLSESLAEEGMLSMRHCERLGPAGEIVQPFIRQFLPDLVCIAADALEAHGDDVLAFCEQLRETPSVFRPVLVLQSDANDQRRIEYLLVGADDVLSQTLSSEELKIRLLVHLRRNLEYGMNPITQLPGLQLTTKITQRRLHQRESLGLVSIELAQLDVYQEAYGELPTRQVLKTFAAMLSRFVLLPDFISHSDENHFIVLTSPERAEKMAALLCRQFDTAAPNFYSEKDRKQGYLISAFSHKVSRRVPLMTLSIGIASTLSQSDPGFLSLFNASQQMRTLARLRPGSTFQSDRLRLAGDPGIVQSDKPGLLILEPDAALAYLLKTTLGMEGYAVEMAATPDEVRQLLCPETRSTSVLSVFEPRLLILDTFIDSQATDRDGIFGVQALLAELRAHFPALKVISISSMDDRQQALQAGVDLYLPKPFELSALFSWVQRLL